MKLRNKKTGRVVNFRHIAFDEPKDDRENYRYSSLAQFNEEWEDYKPTEPLIKDEKIRKAVKAWAEAVGGSPVCFYEDTGYEGVGRLKIYREGYPAVFDLGHQFYDLELNTQYTIAELCGEEEE